MPYRRKHVGMRNEYEVNGDIVGILCPKRGGDMARVLVDLADLELVKAVPTRWRAIKPKKRGDVWYAMAEIWKGETRRYVLMHRLIMGDPSGFIVDHRDGNGLDNRRGNLRSTTESVNNLNRAGARRDSGTGIRGVQRDCNKYIAGVQIDKVRYNLGRYADPQEADKAVKAFLAEKGFQR